MGEWDSVYALFLGLRVSGTQFKPCSLALGEWDSEPNRTFYQELQSALSAFRGDKFLSALSAFRGDELLSALSAFRGDELLYALSAFRGDEL